MFWSKPIFGHHISLNFIVRLALSLNYLIDLGFALFSETEN